MGEDESAQIGHVEEDSSASRNDGAGLEISEGIRVFEIGS